MFEFLPGADPKEKGTVAKPKTFVESIQQDQAAAAEVAKEKENTTVMDGIGATQVKGGIGTIHRFVQEMSFEPEAGYKLPKDFAEQMDADGIDQRQWPLFEKAMSADHFEHLKMLAHQNQDADETLGQFGTGAQIALGMTDPVMFAVDAASGGVGKFAKAGRLLNAAAAGTVAAATNTGVLAASSRYNPEVAAKDLAVTAATSFALAGVLGARKGSGYDAARIKKFAEADTVIGDNQSLSAARVKNAGLLPEDQTPGAPSIRKDTVSDTERLDDALANAHIMPAFGRFRRSLSARMGKAKSPLVRDAGRALFREGVGHTTATGGLKEGRAIAVGESTIENSRRHMGTLDSEFRAGVNAAWDEHKAANGLHFFNVAARNEFNQEVGRAVRGATDVSPAARKAASRVRQVIDRTTALAHESGLDGFDNLDSTNHLPRYYSGAGFRKMFGELGLHVDDVAENVIKPALRSKWVQNMLDQGKTADDVDEKVLSAVAKAMLNRGQKNLEGDFDALRVRSLGPDDVTEMRSMLDESGVAKADIDTFLGKFEGETDEAGKINRAKSRIDIDENFEALVKNASGDDVKVRVSDLFESDVDSVMSRYLREMTGWSAMSSKLGIRNRAEWEKYTSLVKSEAKAAGDNVNNVERLLEIAHNSTFHKSTEPNAAGAASRIGRAVRGYGFLRVMGQVGWSMVAELGPTIAHTGLRNFVKSVPYAKGYIMRAADGSLESSEARVVERMFAPGTDYLRNPPLLHLDDGAMIPSTFGDGPVARAFDNTMNVATHAQGVLSGMAPINTFLQRIAGRGTWLRLIDHANAKSISAADTARMRSWGLSDEMQAKVFATLKGVDRIEDINLAGMDFQTKEAMSAFLYRSTRQQVLEADPGDSIELMHGPVGKIVTQFRGFMVNSYERHFLNGIYHYRDWRTYMMVTLSTGAAGMGWAARTYIATALDPEKREKLLTTENFYKNSVAQSSYSSIFPPIIDMVASDIMGGDPVFQGNRSTGMGNGLNGVPVIDAYNKLRGDDGAIAGIADAFNPNAEVTRKQAESMWKLMWFNNLTGVQQLSNLVLKDAFEKKSRDKAEDE